MGIQAVAEVAQHVLPQPVGEHGLHDPEPAPGDCDGQHHQRQPYHQTQIDAAVGRKQGVVEDHLDQQRIDDAQDRDHHHQSNDPEHSPAVRREQAEDPPPTNTISIDRRCHHIPPVCLVN